MTEKEKQLKKQLTVTAVALAAAVLALCLLALLHVRKDAPVAVRVLLLPKFEVGEMSGDFPGEAQLLTRPTARMPNSTRSRAGMRAASSM